MTTSRTNAGPVISPFGGAPIDANHKELFYATQVTALDASATPVASPLTGTAAITLNIPENAVELTIIHDATSQASTVSFNGESATIALTNSQLKTFPCAGANFKTVTINPGATSTNVYFAFALV